MGSFTFGTSGWSYTDWKGIFYPKGVRSEDYLKHYAAHFPAVELNSSFYRLPKPAFIKNWMDKTPDSFLFCPKLSRLITHIKRLKNCDIFLEEFISIFEPMKKKLGPILIQLPPNLAFESEHESFFALLKKNYSPYIFCLEARHESWLETDILKLLTQYGIGWVIADSGGHFPTLRAATAKTIYFRFHGPGALFASKYKKNQLQVLASDAKKALEEGRDVYAFFNNDYHGYAIENALLFKDLVEKN